MTSESPVYRFLSHPLTGVTVTFVATLVFTVLSRLLRVHHSLWEEAKSWPGQALAAATIGTSLAAALPRLVYEVPVATCEGGACQAEGGGFRVIEGGGFGAFRPAVSAVRGTRCSSGAPGGPVGLGRCWRALALGAS